MRLDHLLSKEQLRSLSRGFQFLVDMLVIRSVRVVIDGWDALHLGFERTQDATVSFSRFRPGNLCGHLIGTDPNAFKEVIQPQVPLRLPCYDFIPVITYTLGPCF